DGDGFKAKDRHDGVGLRGMRERAEQMGGELEITSSRGKGTKITVLLPCNGESMSSDPKRKQKQFLRRLQEEHSLPRRKRRRPEIQNALTLVCLLLMITASSAKAWFHSSLGKQT